MKKTFVIWALLCVTMSGLSGCSTHCGEGSRRDTASEGEVEREALSPFERKL